MIKVRTYAAIIDVIIYMIFGYLITFVLSLLVISNYLLLFSESNLFSNESAAHDVVRFMMLSVFFAGPFLVSIILQIHHLNTRSATLGYKFMKLRFVNEFSLKQSIKRVILRQVVMIPLAFLSFGLPFISLLFINTMKDSDGATNALDKIMGTRVERVIFPQ